MNIRIKLDFDSAMGWLKYLNAGCCFYTKEHERVINSESKENSQQSQVEIKPVDLEFGL